MSKTGVHACERTVTNQLNKMPFKWRKAKQKTALISKQKKKTKEKTKVYIEIQRNNRGEL